MKITAFKTSLRCALPIKIIFRYNSYRFKIHFRQTAPVVLQTSTVANQYRLDVKTFPKCLSLGMAQGSTKKSRNKKMAYTHHNDAMTSAHNTIQHLWCISHGIVMISVSHFLVSRLLVLP